MAYLLNLLYAALLLAVSPWLAWQAVRAGKYRDGLGQKLCGLVPKRVGNRCCIWLHAVSVGEVNLLATLIGELERRHPEWEFVVSTTTRTGFELAQKKYAGRTVFYCPLDFSWAVHSAMRRVRPDLLLLAELELWPNLIAAAKQQHAKVAVFNGRLSERSYRGYSRVRVLVARLLGQLDLIGAQNLQYAGRFNLLGADPAAVHVTGSVKFDGAITDRANALTKRLRLVANFAEDDIVFLAGSTQEPEEELAIATFRQLQASHPSLRLVIVPRHPQRFETVAARLRASGLPWSRRSELPSKSQDPNSRILLVDTVGELGGWWGTATAAFVGGSLGSRGGQNMIEPAAYGAAVSFGPNTRNFRDIVESLLAAKAAVIVADGAELTAFVRRCLKEPLYAAALGERAQALVASQLGATARTADLIDDLLESKTIARADRTAA